MPPPWACWRQLSRSRSTKIAPLHENLSKRFSSTKTIFTNTVDLGPDSLFWWTFSRSAPPNSSWWSRGKLSTIATCYKENSSFSLLDRVIFLFLMTADHHEDPCRPHLIPPARPCWLSMTPARPHPRMSSCTKVSSSAQEQSGRVLELTMVVLARKE